MAEDPFVALCLNEDATDQKVQSAFRRLALRCHPDRHPNDPLAKTRFLRLSRAKETLLDPSKRGDAVRRRQCQRKSGQHAPRQNVGKSEQKSTNKRRHDASQAAAREQQRKASAEKLRRQEMEAKERKRHAQEAAELKRRCAELSARKEAEIRDKAAWRERKTADLFDSFLRKRAKVNPSTSQSNQTGFGALVKNFATSGKQLLVVPGPLHATEYAELQALAASYGFACVEDANSVHVSRPQEHSENDSPWEPPGGTRADRKAQKFDLRAGRPSGGTHGKAMMSEKHRKALASLEARRRSGEGLTGPPQSSWWVHDVEAERFTKDMDRYGF